jgi:type I restriction enzyme M protein
MVTDSIEDWWQVEQRRLDDLRSTADLVDLRAELMTSFKTALQPASMLDNFAVPGIQASWWGASQPDLKALATLGYGGLVDAWVSAVLDALTEDKAKIDPLGHPVARALLPDYLEAVAALEAEVTRLAATIKQATADEEDVEPAEDAPTEADIKQLKSKLNATKRQLKAEKAAFAERLVAAAGALTSDTARELVLNAFLETLLSEAALRVGRHRQLVITAFETWWDKYKTTLTELEARRDSAAETLAGFLKELGYA